MAIMKKYLAIITSLIVVLFSASCGFTVIYDQKDSGINYERELASIKVQKYAGTISQELRTAIYDAINPDHLEEEVKYYLVLDSSEGLASTFLTSSGSSGRNNVSMGLNYQLKLYKNDRVIASGTVSDSESYNVAANRYGNYNSEEFARSNLLKTLAEKLKNMLIQDIILIEKGEDSSKK